MMSSSSQSTIGLAQRKFLAQLRRIPNIFLPLPLHSASHLKPCECIGVCVDSVHQLLSGFVERLNILPHYGVQVEKLNTAVGHPSHHAPQTRPHGGAQRARARVRAHSALALPPPGALVRAPRMLTNSFTVILMSGGSTCLHFQSMILSFGSNLLTLFNPSRSIASVTI